MRRCVAIGLGGLLALSWAELSRGQEKETPKTSEKKANGKAVVYRSVTPEKLETVLDELKIEFKKEKGKVDGIAFYDFERNGFKIRLHNYQGRDLWIDAQFAEKFSLEDVNRWNQRSKFSRAVRLKGDAETVSLESQLDCLGGVTDAIIRQFVTRFDGEIREFAKTMTK